MRTCDTSMITDTLRAPDAVIRSRGCQPGGLSDIPIPRTDPSKCLVTGQDPDAGRCAGCEWRCDVRRK